MRKGSKVQMLILYHDYFHMRILWENKRANHSLEHVLDGGYTSILGRTLLHCKRLLKTSSILASGQQTGDNQRCTCTFPNTPWKRPLPFSENYSSRGIFFIKEQFSSFKKNRNAFLSESVQWWDTLGLVEDRIEKECLVQFESFPDESQY